MPIKEILIKNTIFREKPEKPRSAEEGTEAVLPSLPCAGIH